mmetsp:Transcript_25413/g.22564  ORF Transcript_25413/g.22564 Transcript_25413/m.22564 type:complete len:93 (-) Transcript_25413:1850-2128(-)
MKNLTKRHKMLLNKFQAPESNSNILPRGITNMGVENMIPISQQSLTHPLLLGITENSMKGGKYYLLLFIFNTLSNCYISKPILNHFYYVLLL